MASFGIGCGKRAINFAAIDPGLLRDEITTDPPPERLKRGTRNSALPLVGIVIDQEELDGLEEFPGHIVAAGCRVAGFTQDAPQFVQERFATRNMVAPPGCVFEPLNQNYARRRRELLEVRPSRYGAVKQ
jgi:hypothetical protein